MSALTEFADGIGEVKLLLDFAGDATDLEDQSKAIKNNAVWRASVVLLVSHFENFLKNLAEEFIKSWSTGLVESRSIPEGIREIHTLPRLNEILATSDPRQRNVLLKRLSEVATLWNSSAKPSVGSLQPNVLTRKITSAQSEVIDSIFNLMGSEDLVCDGTLTIDITGQPTHLTNIRRSLEDVLACRNGIAHGDTSQKPTSLDLDRYINFLDALSKKLHLVSKKLEH